MKKTSLHMVAPQISLLTDQLHLILPLKLMMKRMMICHLWRKNLSTTNIKEAQLVTTGALLAKMKRITVDLRLLITLISRN